MISKDAGRLPEALRLYANGPFEKIFNDAANEIERLRAALWHIAQDEFSEAYEHCEDGQNDYWRVVNIARECSSGETIP